MSDFLFIKEVKKQMLKKLKSDRTKFVFVYVIEMGCSQREAAEVLQVHETEVSRQMKRIRQDLQEFRNGYL